MMTDNLQAMEEIDLDLSVLITLTEPGLTPKTRGILAAGKIERAVREWFRVRTQL